MPETIPPAKIRFQVSLSSIVEENPVVRLNVNCVMVKVRRVYALYKIFSGNVDFMFCLLESVSCVLYSFVR